MRMVRSPALATTDARAAAWAAVPKSDDPEAARVRSARVILNRGAGTFQRHGDSPPDEVLAGIFKESGILATFDIIEGARLAAIAARALDMARRGKIDVIVVGGGDGTVRTVAAVVAGSDVPIAILQLGT